MKYHDLDKAQRFFRATAWCYRPGPFSAITDCPGQSGKFPEERKPQGDHKHTELEQKMQDNIKQTIKVLYIQNKAY